MQDASSPLNKLGLGTAQAVPEHPSLNVKETAIYLREHWGLSTTPSSLASMRTNGNGPPFFKIGRRIRYYIHDLDDWGRSKRTRVVRSTSELKAKKTDEAGR